MASAVPDVAAASGRQLRPRAPRKSYALLGEPDSDEEEVEQEVSRKRTRRAAQKARAEAPEAPAVPAAAATAELVHYRHRGLIPLHVIALHVGKFLPDLRSLRSLSETCRQIRELLVRRDATVRMWVAHMHGRKEILQATACAIFGLSVATLKGGCEYREVKRRGARFNYYAHLFRPANVLLLAVHVGGTIGPRKKAATTAEEGRRGIGLEGLFKLRERRARRSEASLRGVDTNRFRLHHIVATENKIDAFEKRAAEVAQILPKSAAGLQEVCERGRKLLDDAASHLDEAIAREAAALLRPVDTANTVLQRVAHIRSLQEFVNSTAQEPRTELTQALTACAKAPSVASGSPEKLLARLAELSQAIEAQNAKSKTVALSPTLELLKRLREEDGARTVQERVQRARSALLAAHLHPNPPRSTLLTAYHHWTFGAGDQLCCAEVVAVRCVVDRLYEERLLRRLVDDLSTQILQLVKNHALQLRRTTGNVWHPSPEELARQLLSAANTVADQLCYDDDSGDDDRYYDYW